MRRFFGAVLIGLGALLLVIGVGLPLYVAPRVTKLPYDMQACPDQAGAEQPAGCLKPSVAEAKDATFLDNRVGKIQNGTLRSTTWVRPQAKLTADQQAKKKLTDDAVVWDVYSSAIWVEDGDDAVMSAYSTELALDRVSGEAIAWDGQWLDESNLSKTTTPSNNVSYKGQVYKFPFGTEKKDYTIYDSNLRTALPAKFVEVADVKGVETYHFKQVIDRQPVVNVSESNLKTLLGLFAPDATSVQVLYSNTREVWVDPATGAYLKVREQQHKVLVPTGGTATETTLLKADFNYTEQTVTNSVASAEDTHALLKLVNLYAPIGAGIIGLLLLAGGFVLASSGRSARTAGEPAAWDATLPQPRHHLRGESGGPGDPAAG